MKTSVNMVRKMGDFNVIQRTKDGMFNATELLKQWNKVPDNPKRDLSKFWESSKVEEFLNALVTEGILNTPKEGYLKTRGKYNGGTWMNPYLFIKFAMWLNPRFEVKVIQFVYDQLIEQRHAAGDMYRTLSNAAKQLPGVDYRRIAKGLNYIVFGRHESGTLRQIATTKQLTELSEIQNKLAFAVDMGYIKSFQDLIDEMKKIYQAKCDQYHDRVKTIPVSE